MHDWHSPFLLRLNTSKLNIFIDMKNRGRNEPENSHISKGGRNNKNFGCALDTLIVNLFPGKGMLWSDGRSAWITERLFDQWP